jgi:predicted dehydrogenase
MTTKYSKPVTIVMVGIGGYGFYYLKTLLEEFPADSIELRGVVDPFAEQSNHYHELKRQKISIFETLEEFYSDGYRADLAVIASPLHFHVSQSCTALKNGSHVLCDKPIGAAVQEAEELIKIRDACQRWVMIGYQWSFSSAIQSLKKDIMQGLFGAPLRLKTLCFWPRDLGYYQRNSWAGRKIDDSGNWVLDSPANNAMAHFLHNLFYVLGEEIHLSAWPAKVTAELFRAYPIENFDSIACRIFTTAGTELLFYASHVTYEDKGPMFNFQFEDAEISYGESSDEIIARNSSGREKSYGSPEDDHQFLKLFEAVETVRTPKPIICGPEAAFAQTLCIKGIQESVPEIPIFPDNMIQWNENRERLWVKGLDEAFYRCYRKGILPNEAGFRNGIQRL